MGSLIGTHLVCKLTLWLYIAGLNRTIPHEGEFICRVEIHEPNTMYNGAPDYVYVDCTKSIAWLDVDHVNKFWYPLEGIHELTGHNCHE